MHSFLQRSAQLIIDQHGEHLSEVCIVLPGKRPMVFLSEILAHAIPGPTWAPAMHSIEEFMEIVSGCRRIEPTALLFKAYEVYRDLAEQPESFDHFLTWIPPLLADFNEVDNYREDGEVVFTNLMEIQGIEDWSFGELPLSPSQERFQKRWELMGAMYSNLKSRLLDAGERTSGLVRRAAANRVQEGWQSPWKHIYFLGFNALSEASQRVFFGLQKSGQATLLWDADRCFVDPPYHEAGRFLRVFERNHGTLDIPARMNPEEIKVGLHECTSRIAQVKAMAELLSDPQLEPEKTAVILADESLLIPAMSSIPIEGAFNITLGYNLRMTPVYDLVMQLLEIRNRSRQRKAIWFRDLKQVLHHPVLADVLAPVERAIRSALLAMAQANQAYLSAGDLRNLLPDEVWLGRMTRLLLNSLAPAEVIHELCGILKLAESASAGAQNAWMEEMIFLALQTLNRCQDELSTASFEVGEQAVHVLLKKALSSVQIDFRGEPRRGLQMMGMLETRTLGFERVIVVGAGESHMPGSRKNQSYIPFDLKVHYQLPTHREHEAIYAYYFFRLLQDAERVDFVYSTQSESMGTPEPSRYILQLLHMQGKAKLDAINWVLPLGDDPAYPTLKQDEQSTAAITSLLEYGLSPSALNTYLRCPLDFYLKYALRFREPDSLEDSFTDALFGTLVHGLLEQLYLEGPPPPEKDPTPLNKVLTPEFLTACLEQLPVLKTKLIGGELSFGDPLPQLESGLNRLSLDTAFRYVEQFLKWELQEARIAPCTLLFLEAGFSRELAFGDQRIRVKGKIDRIDRRGSQVRIIDYKTGSVSQSEIKAPTDAESLLVPKKYKARQLMMYHVAVVPPEGEDMPSWLDGMEIFCGMISLRNLKQGFVSANYDRQQHLPVSAEQRSALIAALEQTLRLMLDPERHWTHDEDSDFCAYCEA